MSFRLGLVEGFYGTPWSWETRRETAALLAPTGCSFYLYAPKGDAFLRRRWREPWPRDTAEQVRELGRSLRKTGVRFGVGLSPLGLREERGDDSLLRKTEELLELGAEHVALLFDDMRGDEPGLAARQLAAVGAIRARFPRCELSLCPTYYSLDPVLERLFGARPAGYLEELGRGLDADVEIFWTGERICSTAYSTEHLTGIAKSLRRKPALWDNYPVNDTERMSRHLHLSPVTGRTSELRELVSSHLVNPMLQPTLSRIPFLTLADSYAHGARYDAERSFRAAARRVAGDELAALLERDRELFHAGGLDAIDRLDQAARRALRDEYARLDHSVAREVTGWLDGAYRVTNETIAAQQ